MSLVILCKGSDCVDKIQTEDGNIDDYIKITRKVKDAGPNLSRTRAVEAFEDVKDCPFFLRSKDIL